MKEQDFFLWPKSGSLAGWASKVSTPNPERVSARDFYFSTLHHSLFPLSRGGVADCSCKFRRDGLLYSYEVVNSHKSKKLKSEVFEDAYKRLSQTGI